MPLQAGESAPRICRLSPILPRFFHAPPSNCCLSLSPWERGLDPRGSRNARQMGRFRCILDASAILRPFVHVCTRCLRPPSLDFEHAKSCVSFNDLPYVFSFLRIDSLEGCFGSNEKILSLLFFHSSFSSSFLVYFKSVLEFDSIKDSLDWKRDEDRFKYERDGASIGE